MTSSSGCVGDGRYSDKGGIGTVTVTGAGSSWESTNIHIGYYGTGRLNIENGGKVMSTNGDIATDSGVGIGNGAVTVTGSGSTWNTDTLSVGSSGTGTLNIENGGKVTSAVSSNISGHTSAVGVVTVTGTGSTWDSGYLFVGHTGTGTLNIENGGKVASTYGWISWGDNFHDDTGVVTVTGAGSTWEISDGLSVCVYGTGTLNITDGGKVKNTQGGIGYSSGSTGIVTVVGAGSMWINSGALSVGVYGAGTLNIKNGGKVSAASISINAASRINIGAAVGEGGVAGGILDTPTITGSGTLQFNHTGTKAAPLYFTRDGTAGGAAITISETVNVVFTSGTTIFGNGNSYSGSTNVTGGSLLVNGDQSAATGTVTISYSATIGGSGTIGGKVIVQNGGTLSPGNSPGTLTVNNDVTLQAGATFLVEIESKLSYDKLVLTGDKTLTLETGAQLQVALNGVVAENDQFVIATGYSAFSGEGVFGNSITANGQLFSIDYSGNQITLTAIPEPSTYALLGGLAALAGAVIARRRRR